MGPAPARVSETSSFRASLQWLRRKTRLPREFTMFRHWPMERSIHLGPLASWLHRPESKFRKKISSEKPS